MDRLITNCGTILLAQNATEDFRQTMLTAVGYLFRSRGTLARLKKTSGFG